MAKYTEGINYAVWFVGPNNLGLPEDLIKNTVRLNGLRDWEKFKDCDTFMLLSQIEDHCHIVHKDLKKFT
jgi:hypothetical protein